MDDAMLTRMLHLTMVFDAKAWAFWASREGVDPRGIAFVLNYPETVTGKRTTPRTLTQFFKQTAGISDLQSDANSWLFWQTAHSTIQPWARSSALVSDELTELISPEEILDAPASAPVKKRIVKLGKRSLGASN